MRLCCFTRSVNCSAIMLSTSPRKSITELMDINPEYANLVRDGKEEKVDPYEVEIGDTIIIKTG